MGSLKENLVTFMYHRIVLALICVVGCGPLSLGAESDSKADKLARLQAARPLNHQVKVTRMGRVLKLDYQLIGSDGKQYSLWDINDRSRPTFAVIHNGTQIGGGEFEFG